MAGTVAPERDMPVPATWVRAGEPARERAAARCTVNCRRASRVSSRLDA